MGRKGGLLWVLVVAAIAVVGCGSSETSSHAESSPESTPAGESPAGESATTSTAATTAQETPSITGFGATDAAWNGAHTEDTNYNHEAAYNPNPALPEGPGGHPGDEYIAVAHTNGRVTRYEYVFASESAKQAQAAILREQFPADASVFRYEVLDTCAIVLVRSPTLAQALGLPAGTPVAQIGLEKTTATGEEPFNPSSVDHALIMEGYPGIQGIKGGKC
jgi:hypothetical protein